MANTNVKIMKKEKDSAFSLLSKFQKKVVESGILPKVRSKRYNQREDSKAKSKKGKMKKLKSAIKFENLKRMGMLTKKKK